MKWGDRRTPLDTGLEEKKNWRHRGVVALPASDFPKHLKLRQGDGLEFQASLRFKRVLSQPGLHSKILSPNIFFN